MTSRRACVRAGSKSASESEAQGAGDSGPRSAPLRITAARTGIALRSGLGSGGSIIDERTDDGWETKDGKTKKGGEKDPG